MTDNAFVAGDMEFKQNKFLPVEKQIVTADPDVNTVGIFFILCRNGLQYNRNTFCFLALTRML